MIFLKDRSVLRQSRLNAPRQVGALTVFAAAVLVVVLAPSGALAQENPAGSGARNADRPGDRAPRTAPKMQKKRPGSLGGGGGRDVMSVLTDEQRKRVRQVLEQVWQTPEVLAARENVQTATEEYRVALKTAVDRVDPEVGKLMSKLHDYSRSQALRNQYDEFKKRRGPMGPGGGPGGPPRPGMRDRDMAPNGNGPFGGLPDFFRNLTEEQKKIFLEARRRAEESEELRVLREQFLGTTDREARFRLQIKHRRLLRDEMLRIDPRIADFTPKVNPSPAGPAKP